MEFKVGDEVVITPPQKESVFYRMYYGVPGVITTVCKSGRALFIRDTLYNKNSYWPIDWVNNPIEDDEEIEPASITNILLEE